MLTVASLVVLFSLNVFAYGGDGVPLKYIASCEIDLNNDNRGDIVFLVETIRGRELLALMKNKKGYDTYVISSSPKGNGLHISCHHGFEIKEWGGVKKSKKIKVPGAYISHFKPVSASVAYYWNGKEFSQIITGD